MTYEQTNTAIDALILVLFGVGVVMVALKIRSEMKPVLKPNSYRGYRLENSSGEVLSERSCDKCPTSHCECIYPLMFLLKQGKKGERLVGLPVDGEKPSVLRINVRGAVRGDDVAAKALEADEEES